MHVDYLHLFYFLLHCQPGLVNRSPPTYQCQFVHRGCLEHWDGKALRPQLRLAEKSNLINRTVFGGGWAASMPGVCWPLLIYTGYLLLKCPLVDSSTKRGKAGSVLPDCGSSRYSSHTGLLEPSGRPAEKPSPYDPFEVSLLPTTTFLTVLFLSLRQVL